MPRETEENSYWWYRDSEESSFGPILVLRANAGTYPARSGQDRQGTLTEEELGRLHLAEDMKEFLDKWDGRKITMKTIDGTQKEIPLVKKPTAEDLVKHAHNPRALEVATSPVLPFFQKNLPKVGESIWIRAYVTRNEPWSLTFAQAAKVLENDESSVYVTTCNDIEAYLCACSYCQRCWGRSENIHANWQREWDFQFSQQREVSGSRRSWQRQYIGHLGAISRALELGLIGNGNTIENVTYLNHSRRQRKFSNSGWSDGSGVLYPRQDNSLHFNVPEFREIEEITVPLPPEPVAAEF